MSTRQLALGLIAAAAGGEAAEATAAALATAFARLSWLRSRSPLWEPSPLLVLIRERDCERELARRRFETESRLEASAAGCLTGLGGRVIDAELEHGRKACHCFVEGTFRR